MVQGLQVIPVRNLREAAGFLDGEVRTAPAKVDLEKLYECASDELVDMADVKGQESVKRAAKTRCCCQPFHPDQPQEKIHPDLALLRHGFHFIGHRHNPEAVFRHSSTIHGPECWRIKQRQASPAATAARWRGI